MKKLLVILLVLAFVAPAMAADNLSIKGQYYVSYWNAENFKDFDDDNQDDKLDYFTQRMRIQPQIKVADGVTANLRFDFGEYDWGTDNYATYRPAAGTNEQFQVDRAYVDITKNIVNIRAGQQFFGVGQNQVFRDNKPGFLVTVKTPVYFGVGYIKDSEGGSNNDESGNEDTDRWVAKVGYKGDAFSVDGFYVMQTDGQDATAVNPKNEPSVAGVYAKSKIGPIDLKGELAFFGGDSDNGTTTTDYVGTQLNVEGIMKLSDALGIGVELIYSDGTDKTNEMKVAYIGDPFARKGLSTGAGLFGDWTDANWKPSTGTPLGTYDVFDPAATGAGAIGGGVGVDWKILEALNLTAYLHYLTSSEDVPGGFDKGMLYQLVVSYLLAPKTKVQAAYVGLSADATDIAPGVSVDLDDASAFWVNLTVNF